MKIIIKKKKELKLKGYLTGKYNCVLTEDYIDKN